MRQAVTECTVMKPPTRKLPSNAPRYDVGGGEMLTSREIAERIGGTQHNVRTRVAKGWKGEALLVPVFERRKPGKPRAATAVIAYTLARTFGSRIPTTKEIRDLYPMEESTAAHWRNTIREALEKSDAYYRKNPGRRRSVLDRGGLG